MNLGNSRAIKKDERKRKKEKKERKRLLCQCETLAIRKLAFMLLSLWFLLPPLSFPSAAPQRMSEGWIVCFCDEPLRITTKINPTVAFSGCLWDVFEWLPHWVCCYGFAIISLEVIESYPWISGNNPRTTSDPWTTDWDLLLCSLSCR